ncbi:MAG: MotA/TolQ/ExbB proton channel family protein [Nevskia sp.]|uniref:MotA/TolQ/ExbB proton channel family protein n=1 Tax=Nevskia sp. TaxID=1929292 RepID=UPI0025CC86BD|nr:MotA/TolQ/ExbB proton channel family protein [Nevskia sp.]MDP3295036.1 MotA/TolQ/ExbB proton channel family protein [Nevskia sp.]
MEFFSTVIRYFTAGGEFMYPILVVLVIGLAITIERLIYLRRASVENREVWAKLMPLVNAGRHEEAEAIAAASTTAIGRVLGYGLARSRGATSREEVELAMEESLMEVTPQLERRTHYLATFANVATLFGLLGTIVGLIAGFTAVSGVNPAQKQDQLSAAVAVAMNCTAFGLITAIPLLLIHAWLVTKTDEMIDSLEIASVKFLNSLGLKK